MRRNLNIDIFSNSQNPIQILFLSLRTPVVSQGSLRSSPTHVIEFYLVFNKK